MEFQISQMRTELFHTTNIIEKLVDHYGLPAFLFEATATNEIRIRDSKTIVLVPYAQYTHIDRLKPSSRHMFLFEDLWRSKEPILASQISRHAGYHEKINARSAKVLRIEKKEAESFMDRYHLMGSAQAAYHYGIVHEKQLVAAATFSKGRKMHRLPQGLLSFELIRLASLPGITVTGNLSRLVQQFYRDHHAGDVMTYVDVLLGDKISFEKTGFIADGKTTPVQLWVNTHTHQRFFREPEDKTNVVTFHNAGNYKLIKNFEQV
jgi:hypothetical protein